MALENDIVIDNRDHDIEDSIKFTNQSSEMLSIEILVKRKQSSSEKSIASAVIPSNCNNHMVETTVDDDLDDYDYIIIRPMGKITKHEYKCSHDDLIFTIIEHKSNENKIKVDDINATYENSIKLENESMGAKDYFKVDNKSGKLISYALIGIDAKGKKTYLARGNISSQKNHTTKIATHFDGKLNGFVSFVFSSDVKILDFESNCDHKDLNLIIYEIKENLPKKESIEPMVVVIDVPNISKNQLYVRASSWMVEFFNNSDSVIEFSDKESGIIKGKYATKLKDWELATEIAELGEIRNALEKATSYEYSVITIDVKNNKARITVQYFGDPIVNPSVKIQYQESINKLISSFENAIKKQEEEW